MCYNQYLYRLSGQVLPITDVVKMSLSVADLLAESIIGTPLITADIISHVNNIAYTTYCSAVL